MAGIQDTMGFGRNMSLLSDAAADLYSADPESFTARRKELAAQARRAGDAEAAKSIAALGKPTKSAWLVNKLVRDDPTVPQRLADLGDQLRAGEAALDGASIRKLSAARRELIDSLVKQALGADAQRQAALREEVTGTLNAALADPDVAKLVSGRHPGQGGDLGGVRTRHRNRPGRSAAAAQRIAHGHRAENQPH